MDKGFLSVPGDLIWAAGRPVLSFVEIPRSALSATFWSDTLKRRRKAIGLTALDAYTPRHDDLRLAGAIHHTGRCGSTLMVRQFAAVKGVIALSEPTAFQQLLDAPFGTARERQTWLRLLMAAHCDALCPNGERLVIKWPVHLIFWAEELARALPDVPTIFLYRDPVEIIASLAENPFGNVDLARTNPFAPALTPALTGAEARANPDLAYHLLAARCSAVARVSAIRSLDYACLPSASWQAVAPYFNIALTEQDASRMARASGYYSKAADRLFEPDGDRRQAAAGEEIRTRCASIVTPVLDETLRALRSL